MAGRQLGEEEWRQRFGKEEDAQRGGAAAWRSAPFGHLTSFVSRIHNRRAKGRRHREEEAAVTPPPSRRATRAEQARSRRRGGCHRRRRRPRSP
uniref:Uncharacterized protein n=1 Tax=Oryza rufipogon TaxID=4529 RepID=A0A0E0NDF8_ORYRU